MHVENECQPFSWSLSCKEDYQHETKRVVLCCFKGPCHSRFKRDPLGCDWTHGLSQCLSGQTSMTVKMWGLVTVYIPVQSRTQLSWCFVGLGAEIMRHLTRPWRWKSRETEATSNSQTSWRTRPSAVQPASHCIRGVRRRLRTWGEAELLWVWPHCPSLLQLEEESVYLVDVGQSHSC